MTYKRFTELAAQWKANGQKVTVIKRGTREWWDWTLYYHQFSIFWAFDIMDRRDTWTVPCGDPGVFDPAFDRDVGYKIKQGREAPPDQWADRAAFVHAAVNGTQRMPDEFQP